MIDVFEAASAAHDIGKRGDAAIVQFGTNDDAALRANLIEVIRNATLILEFLDTSNE